MNLTVLAHIESTTPAQQLKRTISKGVELHINTNSKYCISNVCDYMHDSHLSKIF